MKQTLSQKIGNLLLELKYRMGLRERPKNMEECLYCGLLTQGVWMKSFWVGGWDFRSCRFCRDDIVAKVLIGEPVETYAAFRKSLSDRVE